MNDDTPIFTEDDDSVDQEIAENEERAQPPHENRMDHAIDRVFVPIARILHDDNLTPEESAEVARENNREQDA